MNVKSSAQCLQRGKTLVSNYYWQGTWHFLSICSAEYPNAIPYNYFNVYSGLSLPKKQQVIRVKPGLHNGRTIQT